jgi:hypothetical protein
VAKKIKALPKNTQIQLGVIGSEGKQTKKFNQPHALNLLRLKNSVWKIQDERFIFENNEIKRRPIQAEDSETKE